MERRHKIGRRGIRCLLALFIVTAPAGATWGAGPDADKPQSCLWDAISLHGQFTVVAQMHPTFTSPFEGPNSLQGRQQTKETIDATMFLGVRLSDSLAFYVNPEVDQGFGLSNTLGLAGYASGEAYKVGSSNPYLRLQRAFFRYTIDLGGERAPMSSAPNQVPAWQDANNIVITIGKISAVDIFDTNAYAHDPRGDFLNWSVIDSGGYDYAADAWGYSYGVAVEWTQDWWTLRTGLFDLSTVPNTTSLETGFQQFEIVAEAEARHTFFARPGKIKLLGFANRGRMGKYADAVRLALISGGTPDTAQVRRYRTRPGMALNIEQSITPSVGFFARMSLNDGSKEAFEFTEINRSVAAGIAVQGASWHRTDDMLGVALVGNELSNAARQYFANGGIGILIGDGRLPRSGWEKILELYYKVGLTKFANLTLDYQHIANPAYDALRGPVDILGIRFHGEF